MFFLQMLVALKTACCDVWKLECQACDVTASVQSDHLLYGHTFLSYSPLINRIVHHAVLKFSLCLNKSLPQLFRITDWYILDTQAPASCPRCENLPDLF